MKPYDATIGPVENMSVSVLALGEGFHNYHHTFPQDYSTSEWGTSLNLTTAFIHLMAGLGWAYDLRRPSPRTGLGRLSTAIAAMALACHHFCRWKPNWRLGP